MASRKETRRAKRIVGKRNFRITAPERVCGLLRQGLSLRAVAACKRMPTLDTLTRWLTEDSAFRADYDRAREAQREIFLDDVVALADALAGSSAAGLKLRIEARKWRVALMDKEAARKDAGNDGTVNDEIIERLEAAQRRIDEDNARRRDESPDDATVESESASGSGAQDGDEWRTIVYHPKADAVVDVGEDNSSRYDAREWAMGVHGPARGSGGDVSDHSVAPEWWR